MYFEPTKFEHLLGTPGFSDQILKNHFTLYQGYVANTNKLVEKIIALSDSKQTATLEFAELKHRLGWEFNGMRLHELYFQNLSKNPVPPDENSALYKKITAQYGSLKEFEEYFRATAAMRGIGWAVSYYDKQSDFIFTCWINEHDVGHLTGCVPILVADVFEHAYLTDYGLKRADYLDSFFKAIGWKAVEQRFAP
ncbi:TPA: superoxide dismutase [Candidatus Micrarchaeota archaeon]|nr:MAG: superoxide dismutase [Candidatus Micrarchaeota archaeon CG1_02_51_15]HII38800.1 superoxide dismutase [Candidatus Micrarchaeota archaeon]